MKWLQLERAVQGALEARRSLVLGGRCPRGRTARCCRRRSGPGAWPWRRCAEARSPSAPSEGKMRDADARREEELAPAGLPAAVEGGLDALDGAGDVGRGLTVPASSSKKSPSPVRATKSSSRRSRCRRPATCHSSCSVGFVAERVVDVLEAVDPQGERGKAALVALRRADADAPGGTRARRGRRERRPALPPAAPSSQPIGHVDEHDDDPRMVSIVGGAQRLGGDLQPAAGRVAAAGSTTITSCTAWPLAATRRVGKRSDPERRARSSSSSGSKRCQARRRSVAPGARVEADQAAAASSMCRA